MQETVNFGGWPNCLRLANDQIEVIVTRDVGPRIVRFAFLDGPNELREFPDQQGVTGGDAWRLLGGHRLWHAPEAMPRTYSPDNSPVRSEGGGDRVQLIPEVEPSTGIQKMMGVELHSGPHVTVTHTLTNQGLWPVTLAPWAITVMAPGGTAIIPQPELLPSTNLLPNRSITLWPYTAPNDPRILWGGRFLRIRPDGNVPQPIKLGTQAHLGWCGYVNRHHFFLKRVPVQCSWDYPDFGCGIECYTAEVFLELETLGPLTTLEPGASATHTEEWYLFDGTSSENEEAVARTVLPLVESTGRVPGG